MKIERNSGLSSEFLLSGDFSLGQEEWKRKEASREEKKFRDIAFVWWDK